MKIFIFILITAFYILPVFGQSGLNNGNLFLLQKDKKTISLNFFENDSIKELRTFSISDKSIYTTDQISKVVILDTATNNLSLFDIETKNKTELKIPFDLKPKTILLNNENLLIGGEMGKEMLIQYHLQNEEWYKLQIPIEVMFPGKAIDDLVVNDSLLIAIDNIVMPKYVLFYNLNSRGKLEFLHFKKLKSNGAYESIYQGRITENYLGLISGTYSGYVGATDHITIYDNLNLKNSFAISSNQNDKDYQTFTDFLIVKDKIAIASKEKGLGIFKIKNSYFKETDEFKNSDFNIRISTLKIKYTDYKNEAIIEMTIVPNTEIIILTLETQKGNLRYEINEI